VLGRADVVRFGFYFRVRVKSCPRHQIENGCNAATGDSARFLGGYTSFYSSFQSPVDFRVLMRKRTFLLCLSV
jgi:hypothetical protein